MTRRRLIQDPRKRRIIAWSAAALLLAVSVPLGYYLYVGLWCSNFHTVVPGQVYRSGNPWGNDLRNWHARYGIQTVVDLRADGVTHRYPDEEKAVRESGMRLEYVHLSVNRRPDAATLRRLIQLIETSPRPLLVHCQGGADRSGLASFIAAMAIDGQTYSQAEKQFSVWYFHVLTDLPVASVLRLYRQYCRANHLDTDGWAQFRTWAMTVYTGNPASSSQPAAMASSPRSANSPR